MALTPTDNEAFLREVDDDLRRDQLTDFLRRWGKLVATLVAVGLAALACFLWWQSHRAAQAGVEGEQFTAVLNDIAAGKANPADPRLATLAQDGGAGYRAMARLTQADLTARTNPAAGVKAFDAIVADAALPEPVRDLATLRGTTLAFDTLPPQQVIDRLKTLAQAGNPWFANAAELTAAADLKLNRRDAAGALYAAIARDPGTPASLRGRAAGMASALGQTVAPFGQPGTLKE